MAKGQPQIQLNGAMIVFPGLKISPPGTRTSRPTESQITVKESKKISSRELLGVIVGEATPTSSPWFLDLRILAVSKSRNGRAS